MRILFITWGKYSPSSRYRVEKYLPYLEKKGIEPTLFPTPKNPFRIFRMIRRLLRNDVVFIQKNLFHWWELSIISLLNSKIIFDFDDILIPERPDSECKSRIDILKFKLHVRIKTGKFRNTLRKAKHLIVGNKYLKEYSLRFLKSQKHITIIPTPIDTRQYTLKRYEKSEKVIIGWVGLPGNLRYLELLRDVFKLLSAKYKNIAVKIVCSRFLKFSGVNVIEKQWRLEDEVSDLHTFDIGVMPLFEDPWSEAKCSFKALQYMAVGVPAVVSPVGMNKEIIKDGEGGFLADSKDVWVHKLSRLIEDEQLRQEIGTRGRKVIEERYSIDLNIKRLIKVFDEVSSG